MSLRDELILRCARHREAALGGLSPEGFAELEAAVKENVTAFIDTPEDVAFAEVTRACETYAHALLESESLDDSGYERARAMALNELKKACKRALATDPGCVDARHMFVVATTTGLCLPNLANGKFLPVYDDARRELNGISRFPGGLSSENVFLRPYLRLLGGLARQSVACTRYRAVLSLGDELLRFDPADGVGIRHTMAIAYARLEDEAGLNALDDRFDHESTAWSLLARTLLLYRLERFGSARRALRSFVHLVDGGAYALLRPVLLPPYLPERPKAAPLGFDAAMQAVFETETVIADTPGFIAWTQEQPGTVEAARVFADTNGFEWE